MSLLDSLSLPFLTRNMLAFEHGTAFTLRVISASRAANTLQIRGMTREGVFTFKLTTTTGEFRLTSDFRIPDIPITVSVIDSGQVFANGDCFVQVILMANGDPLMELCAGYVFKNRSLTYPQGNSIDPIPNKVCRTQIQSADPAAGANGTITVPLNQFYKVHSVSFTFVTDATVANRRMIVKFSNTATVVRCFSLVDQAASATYKYTLAPYGYDPGVVVDNDILIPMPPNIELNAAGTITTEILNLQAGDNLGIMSAGVEIYLPHQS